MEHTCNWSNLPNDIIRIVIVHGSSCLEDYIRFTAVCKSWNSATENYKPLLPPRNPWLLLAEDVLPGSIISDAEFDSDSSYSNNGGEFNDEDDDEDYDHNTKPDNCSVDSDDDDDIEEDDEDDGVDGDNGDNDIEDDDDDGDNDTENDDDSDNNSEHDDDNNIEDDEEDEDYYYFINNPFHRYDHQNNSIGTSRGLYSLSTGKTYLLELPEASGRLILGANHGWLLTLGRDLQIHLLHPLLRYQILLPPMPTLPIQFNYEVTGFDDEELSDMFIRKVVMSSKVPDDTSTLARPIIMVSYGECGYLAFFRLGDEAWTHVDLPARSTMDIIYHRGRFYAVNTRGNVFVCRMDDKGGPRAIQIASLCHHYFYNRKYLVESISGTLFLLVHICKTKYFYPSRRPNKYRTTKFLVWKLELDDSLETPSCTLIKENNLGNQAIFVGRGSSVAVPSSETIRPNCIYFTDDRVDCYQRQGGGHDMGIFNMADRTIEPHFPGKSIHFISPPLWYI